MGYTHYFKNKGHEDDKINFLKVLDDTRKMIENLPEFSSSAGGYYGDKPIKLRGFDGSGEPVLNDDMIGFNGDGEFNLDHETFFVTPSATDFDFCKTARKPYDLMVCGVLISMKKHLKNFSYSSDGDKKDWKPAKNFYKKVCGKLT